MSGSLAIVTGAAGGLGEAIAERLGGAGHPLLLLDIDPRVDEVASRLSAGGAEAAASTIDLTDAGAGAEVASTVAAGDAQLGILINNAGITRDARVGDMEADDVRTVLAVNLGAAMRLTLALERLFEEGSAVVSISSRAALGNFGQLNYVASKAALIGFTRALALRWAPRVRVNAVAPGLIDTPMTRAMPDRVREKLVARIPAGRIGRPEDVAEAVAYLASPAADYVTGQVLLSCGGRSIAP